MVRAGLRRCCRKSVRKSLPPTLTSQPRRDRGGPESIHGEQPCHPASPVHRSDSSRRPLPACGLLQAHASIAARRLGSVTKRRMARNFAERRYRRRRRPIARIVRRVGRWSARSTSEWRHVRRSSRRAADRRRPIVGSAAGRGEGRGPDPSAAAGPIPQRRGIHAQWVLAASRSRASSVRSTSAAVL